MTILMNRIQSKVWKAATVALAFCMALFLLAPAALAAPEDEQEEVIEIDLTEDQDPGSSASTRLVINEDEEMTDYMGGDDQEEETEEDQDGTDTEPSADTEEDGEQEEIRNPGAFTVDGNGTIQDIIADGTKEFYVITTDNGGVFYLLIDRAGDIDNVYFLSAVDETDIQDFVKEPVYTSASEETGTTTVVTTTAGDESSGDGTGTESDTSENSSSSSGSSYAGLIVLVIIVVAVIVIVLVRRSRKNRKNGGKPEEGSEDADPKDFYQDHDDDEDI